MSCWPAGDFADAAGRSARESWCAAALATVSGALILLMGLTHVTDVAQYSVDVITLFGLALAVDYSLLILKRFREARAAGADVPAAVGGSDHRRAARRRGVSLGYRRPAGRARRGAGW